MSGQRKRLRGADGRLARHSARALTPRAALSGPVRVSGQPWAALYGREVLANQLPICVARLPAIRTRPGVQINLGR